MNHHLAFTAARRRRDLTQAQLATYVGKSRWTIIDVESGRRPKLPGWAVAFIQETAATDLAAWRRNDLSSFSQVSL